MRLPWISRTLHAGLVELLSEQISELKEERKILLNRLALLGFGGALFVEQAQQPEEEEEEKADELIDPYAEIRALAARMRRRPSAFADALTAKRYRDRAQGGKHPQVAWIPQADKINSALDEAEAAGRKQA